MVDEELCGKDVKMLMLMLSMSRSTLPLWLFRSYTKHYWDSSVQVPLERVLMGNPWEQHKLSFGSSSWNKLTDFLVFHSPNLEWMKIAAHMFPGNICTYIYIYTYLCV